MRSLFLTFALAACLALVPARAHAYLGTCSDVASLIMSNDEKDNALGFGYVFGDSDLLAGLLCFAGNRQCECAQAAVSDRVDEFARALVDNLDRCIRVDGSQAAFGAVNRAIRQLCPY